MGKLRVGFLLLAEGISSRVSPCLCVLVSFWLLKKLLANPSSFNWLSHISRHVPALHLSSKFNLFSLFCTSSPSPKSLNIGISSVFAELPPSVAGSRVNSKWSRAAHQTILWYAVLCASVPRRFQK